MLFINKKTGKQAELEIRPFREGDEEAFKGCICDFYGDGYPYTEYFEKGFLAELCKLNKMYLLCAVTKDGDIAGTVGARFDADFPGSCIMCLRVVKKEYGGMGIASAQRTLLLEYLNKRHDVRSLYVDALAHDSFSQQDLLQFGFVTCGIRLEIYNANIMIPGKGYSENDRISQTIMCKSQGVKETCEFFCPPEHEEIISSIYNRLGVTFKKCSGKSAEGDTVFTEHTDGLHKSTVLIMKKAGTDFSDVILRFMDKVKAEDTESFICYLNLTCPGAEAAYTELVRHGLFFSGMKPLNTDGEYIVMTYLKAHKFARRLINACEDGEQLVTYIESDLK